MARVNSLIGTAAVMAVCCSSSLLACPTRDRVVTAAGCRAATPAAPSSLEPAEFFEDLVARYRTLTAYEDTAHLVQTATTSGREPRLTEADIICAIRDDEPFVMTPARQIAGAAGIDAPADLTPAMKALARKYNLWLAPHLALRFTDEPLTCLMPGVEEALIPTSLKRVRSGDRELIRVELRSGDGASRQCAATFQLDVDPQSMLIRRIESRQILPDGARYETTLDILPTRVETGEASALVPIASGVGTDARPGAARARSASKAKPEEAPAEPGSPKAPANPTGRAVSTPPEQ